MTERRPAEVFHPGEYLLDELNARGWTQTEFAEIIRRPVRLVNEIVNRKKGITTETAQELAAALGTSAELWINLDAAYNLWKSEKDLTPIKHRARLRSKYPLRDMILRGWLQASESVAVLESQLLRYFEIESLDQRPLLANNTATKRSGEEAEELSPIQTAWLYRVKHIAASMHVPKYSEERLLNCLELLKALRANTEEIKSVPSLLENCGVRFVIVEPLNSSKLDGACFWLADDAPVLSMSLRFDRIDNFWFVLRHEIEHVLKQDGKSSAVIDTDLFNSQDEAGLSKQEKHANSVAAEFCTPQVELSNFIARNDPYFSRKNLLGFSARLGLHPGLVTGQLHQRTKRYELFRSLLVPVKENIIPAAMTDGYGNALPITI